jgi:hypothetical protein
MPDETDILLDEYGDFVTDTGGDAATVSGDDALTQDVRHRFMTEPGSLPDDGTDAEADVDAGDPAEYGVGTVGQLHGEMTASWIKGFISRAEGQIGKDARLNPAMTAVRPVAIGEESITWRIRFQRAEGGPILSTDVEASS